MASRKIMSVTVVYDDMSTESFTGQGTITHTDTYTVDERWDFAEEPPKLKQENRPVKYLTIGMTQ